MRIGADTHTTLTHATHSQIDEVAKSLENPTVAQSHVTLETALSAVRNLSNDTDSVKKMISLDVHKVTIDVI